jgi:hypothetical protein
VVQLQRQSNGERKAFLTNGSGSTGKPLFLFSVTTVTSYHEVGGLKQNKFIPSQL